MQRLVIVMVASVLATLLAGCSTAPSKPMTVAAVPAVGKTLRASGFSRFEDGGNLTVHQRWLAAQQSAKLDAYRDLAAQLYQEILPGNTTVGALVLANEAYRVYVDAFLREARASDYRTVKDSLKTTLELTLTDRFMRCMSSDANGVSRCLEHENKMAFTRTGSKPAMVASVNMACAVPDCSDQLSMQGFSKDRNAVDSALLDAGLYDVEWALNTSANTAARFLLLGGTGGL